MPSRLAAPSPSRPPGWSSDDARRATLGDDGIATFIEQTPEFLAGIKVGRVRMSERLATRVGELAGFGGIDGRDQQRAIQATRRNAPGLARAYDPKMIWLAVIAAVIGVTVALYWV